MLKKIITHLSILTICLGKTIMINMETNLGLIQIELYPDKAPITVSNFLQYVDETRYGDLHFYRVVHLGNQPDNEVKIEVIQGGLEIDKHPMELPPIHHETTNKTNNFTGSLSIHRTRSSPHIGQKLTRANPGSKCYCHHEKVVRIVANLNLGLIHQLHAKSKLE